MRRLARGLAVFAVNAVVALALLCIAEGAASLLLIAHQALTYPALAERSHTEHDALLGWIHRPHVSLRDLYGPGHHLTTNGQRFRGIGEHARQVPAGRARIICAGDSFTLGYGVDDADTWCAQLARQETGVETVNMGQGGYGVDQAFLWYRRDGTALEHGIVLLALITDDILRAGRDDFLGYPKPRLVVQGGALQVTGTPVPQPGLAPFFAINLQRLDTLALMQVARRLRGGDPVPAARDAELEHVLAAMLRELAATAGPQRLAVVVYLPTLADYTGASAARWRAFLAREAPRHGIGWLDLVAALRRVPAGDVESLFIGAGDPAYRGTPGHYTERGHRFVAARVGEFLRSDARAAALIGGPTMARGQPAGGGAMPPAGSRGGSAAEEAPLLPQR